jgi:hypothetical protein
MGAFISKTANEKYNILSNDLKDLIYLGFTDAELQELGLVDSYDEENAVLPDYSHNILINY